jgi:hypothetical protein
MPDKTHFSDEVMEAMTEDWILNSGKIIKLVSEGLEISPVIVAQMPFAYVTTTYIQMLNVINKAIQEDGG